MGYKVVGSDISKERVNDTKENLRWLANKYNLRIKPEKDIFQADALSLTGKELLIRPDAIVSEVYLGPPLTGNEGEKNIFEIAEDLEKKYRIFLKNQYLKSNIQHLVLAIPFFKVQNKRFFLNIIDDIEKNGYNVINSLKGADVDFGLLPEYNQNRGTILYSRPDQTVGREIMVLGKK